MREHAHLPSMVGFVTKNVAQHLRANWPRLSPAGDRPRIARRNMFRNARRADCRRDRQTQPVLPDNGLHARSNANPAGVSAPRRFPKRACQIRAARRSSLRPPELRRRRATCSSKRQSASLARAWMAEHNRKAVRRARLRAAARRTLACAEARARGGSTWVAEAVVGSVSKWRLYSQNWLFPSSHR